MVVHARGYVQLLLSSTWPSVAEGAERCSPAESPLMGARVRAHVTSFGKFGAKGTCSSSSSHGQ